MSKINKDDIVSFTDESKNARGYPLTAIVLECQDNGNYLVNALGLLGPGSETIIADVPEEVLNVCTPKIH